MSDSIQKYLDFHKEAGGTGKLFNFKLISYQEDCLELEGEFPDETLNPDGSVQGGMMTAMLDDVTALLIIINSNATIYPCLLYTSPSPRDPVSSRMPSSA